MSMKGSLRAYARHRKETGLIGGTVRAVQKARDAGRIKVGKDGQVDFEVADAAWAANTNRHQQRPQRRSSNQPTKIQPKGRTASDEPELDDGDFLEAQRQHEWEKVRKERLARQVRESELVEAADAVREWGRMISAARSAALLMPDKLAPKVAVVSDVRECRALISASVNEFLSELSEYQPNG